MNRSHRIAIALLAVAASTTGCDRPEEHEDDHRDHVHVVGEAEKNAYAASWSRWPVSAIPVCWENPDPEFEQERAWVKDAVARSWPAHAPIDFVEWDICKPDSRGIRILVEDDGPHVKALGRHLDGMPQGMVLNFTFRNWSQSCQNDRQHCIEAIAVHEFGHALGFAHEHNRSDRPASCVDAPQGTDGDVIIGDWDLHSVMNYCNPEWNGDGQLSDTDIAGLRAMYGTETWTDGFGTDRWNPARHLRLTGDVDGNGTADIVGFGEDGVYVSLSDGVAYGAPKRWLEAFAIGAGSWRVDEHPRLLADVNGDGRVDIVGFGKFGVDVSVSTGKSFTAPQRWSAAFGGVDDWQHDRHLRTLADVNGDGRADVIGFGDDATHVALSVGDGFAEPVVAAEGFAREQGWRVDRHPRVLADVNGDGRADVVGFGDDGVYIAYGEDDGRLSALERVIDGLGHAHGYRIGRTPRMLADVNGDGRADIVAFDTAGTLVALAEEVGFTSPVRVLDDFGARHDWLADRHLRLLGDVDGDGRADIVAFGDTAVQIARGTADGGFGAPDVIVVGMTWQIEGWTAWANPRALVDADGDGALDVLGFGPQGVHVFVY